MKTKGKPQAAKPHTLKQAYALGFKEADGDMGMTYDNDPGSPRSAAYDKGRAAGQKALEKAAKPSPLPWVISGFVAAGEAYTLIKDADFMPVAKVNYEPGTGAMNSANAALIVRAVNNYQPMIDAAKDVLANWEAGDLAGAVNSLRLAMEEAEGNL